MSSDSVSPSRLTSLVFLPGIGGNELLFDKQLSVFSQATVPQWQKPQPAESLASYAQRWAKDWRAESYVLVGMSFGGMVALELAKHLPVKGVVLISSLWDRSVVSAQFALFERCSRLLPSTPLKTLVRNLGPAAVKRRNQLSSEDEARLQQMASQLDIDFARWACQAVVSWKGALDVVQDPPFEVRALHGRQDPVIRLPRTVPSWVTVIENGRHFLPYSHPDRVNHVIGQVLSGGQS